MENERIYKTLKNDSFNRATKVGFASAGSEEWHEMRRQGIGGSEVGTIMGLNPWESAFALWAKRTGQIPDPPLSSWGIRFGNAFESPILDLWAEEHPEYEIFLAGTYRHPEHTFMLANPDALARHRTTGEWVVVEIKTSRTGWAEVPPSYRAQVVHYMTVFDVKKAFIVAVAGWNWEEYEIEFDDFEAQAQVAACERFWAHLQDLVKPGWDGSKATYEATRYLNRSVADSEVDLSDLGFRLLEAHKAFREADAVLHQMKSEVLDKMGDSKYGYVNAGNDKRVVAQKQSRGQGTPWLVVKADK